MLRHKFNAIACTEDKIKFPSKAQRRRYLELKALKKQGEVIDFLREVPFYFTDGTKYVCDFLIFWKDGRVTVEDVKGVITPVFKLKRKRMEHEYPHFPIVLVFYKAYS